MRLARQTHDGRRKAFAACAGHPNSPMSEPEKHLVQRLLLNHHWAPTPQDTPVPFGAVEAWYADLPDVRDLYEHPKTRRQ